MPTFSASQKASTISTANCPAIVKLIEKFHPEMTPNLAPLVSPMIATAMVVKKIYGEDVATVQIGPCIDAKDEALIYKSGKLVEGVLTFIELRQLFEEFKIQERLVKMSDFDPPYGYWGALYPVPAGIIQAGGIKRDMVSSRVITAAGKEDILEAINDFRQIHRYNKPPFQPVLLSWMSARARNGISHGKVQEKSARKPLY